MIPPSVSNVREQMAAAQQQQHQAIQLPINEKAASTVDQNRNSFGFSLFKKSGSTKGGSQKSGGAGSAVTSLSDLEKIDKIMNEAQHANKSIVKYFGKHFEEFRREMHSAKELVFADELLGVDNQ